MIEEFGNSGRKDRRREANPAESGEPRSSPAVLEAGEAREAGEAGEFAALDALLDREGQSMPELPPALAARMLADAREVQAELARREGPVSGRDRNAAAAARPSGTALGEIFGNLRAAIGGWAPVGGLAAAGLAGIWIGFSPPSAALDPVSLLIEARQELDIFDPAGAGALELPVEGDAAPGSEAEEGA